MILRMPVYCRDFACSADKCSDNCCIGWEIDIDSKTADYYMNLGGEFGERLKKNISTDDGYSFILKNERCPFLNDRNLCDIILNTGEDKLCYICDNHPRYYEWFSGIKEGGMGLCCEEAAMLIIKRGGETGYWDRTIPDEECDEYNNELYDFLFQAREKLTALFRNGNIPLSTAVYSAVRYADTLQYMIDNGAIDEIPDIEEMVCQGKKPDVENMLSFFGSLEPIDENWQPYVEELKRKIPESKLTPEQERYIRNIGIYFIWRYFMKGVFDEEIFSKVELAAVSMAVISLMFRAEPEGNAESYACLAKNYSKEIEYSEENLQEIYDMSYTSELFLADNLAAFF